MFEYFNSLRESVAARCAHGALTRCTFYNPIHACSGWATESVAVFVPFLITVAINVCTLFVSIVGVFSAAAATAVADFVVVRFDQLTFFMY